MIAYLCSRCKMKCLLVSDDECIDPAGVLSFCPDSETSDFIRIDTRLIAVVQKGTLTSQEAQL